MGKVWVVGSAMQDIVHRVKALPAPGESVFAASATRFLGGKGVNQAVAAARMGGEANIVCCVGEDHSGNEFVDFLRSEGLGTEHVRRAVDVSTGQANIAVAEDGSNMITAYPGANFRLTAVDVPASFIEPTDIVLTQLEVPDGAVLAAAACGKVIFNPAPYRPVPPGLLASCWIVTPNETEAHAMTGIFPDTTAACRACCNALLDQGCQNVVLTLGARGTYWKSRIAEEHFPAPEVRAVDTTAAGDVFNGALAAGLAGCMDLPAAVHLAVRAAAISTTRPGAADSAPYLYELDRVDCPE